MATQATMTEKQIQKLWDSQPFIEKVLFLMSKLKISQDESEKLAKLKYDKIGIAYRYQIYLFLN